jgi:hypothetical protein
MVEMKEYNEAKERIAELGEEKIRPYGGVPFSAIDECEKLLSVVFPMDYRAFLHDFGGGAFCYSSFTGISETNPLGTDGTDLVWSTLDARKMANLPHDYVLIEWDDMGGGIVLNCTNGEVCSTELNPEMPENINPIFPSFGAYLRHVLSLGIDSQENHAERAE